MRYATLRSATKKEEAHQPSLMVLRTGTEGNGIMEISAREYTQNTIATWKDFGPLLRSIRKARELSQDRLADALGCNRTHIWRLEHGQAHPSRMFLRSLELLWVLTPDETRALGVFKTLREYHLDSVRMK